MTSPWNLTDREQEVLRLLTTATQGGDKAIARQLGICAKTVNTHLMRAYEKMGARSRIEAALMWDREFNRGTTVEPCTHCQGLGFTRKVAA